VETLAVSVHSRKVMPQHSCQYPPCRMNFIYINYESFEVLKKIFGPKKGQISNLEYYTIRNLVISAGHLVLLVC
jgi:hypothetical protein